MKTAEMIAKSLTSSEKDTAIRINVNPKDFHDINMAINGYYSYFDRIPLNSSNKFINDICVYLLQQGFLNTAHRPVFDLKSSSSMATADTDAFTNKMMYIGNLIIDRNLSLMLYDHSEKLPADFLSRPNVPTCIIICNPFDDKALIFGRYTDESLVSIKSVIRTDIKPSEIHFSSRSTGFTTEAIAAIIKLALPTPVQFRNPNYNTGENKSALAHLQHYARHHNIPGERPPSIDNSFGIHPHFSPAFQPNYNANDLNEMRWFTQRLQNDLFILTNRVKIIEAKVSNGTNVADEMIPPTVDEQSQSDKVINKDMLDATDDHTRTTRDIRLGNVDIPNFSFPNYNDVQIGALATEIAKISQRLEHLENSVYNKTSDDVLKHDPSLGYPSND